MPEGPIHTASNVLSGIAVGIVVIALLRGGSRPHQAPALLAGGLALGLEFLLAGGLLRLSANASFLALATAALIVLVRKVATTGIRWTLQALGMSPVRRRAPDGS